MQSAWRSEDNFDAYIAERSRINRNSKPGIVEGVLTALLVGASQIDTSDPAALEGYFTDTETAFANLVSAAPDEIKADAQTLDSSFGEIMTALRAIDFDPTAVDPAIFETATADEANNRVDSYYSANCAATG